ncbi:MAG: NAD-binding protein [Phycisphaerae bacterium]|nr:NAD-binding protein [Saprospiraceae bacterium]
MIHVIHLLHLLRAKEIHFTQKGRLDHFRSAVRRLWVALGLLVIAVLIGMVGYHMIIEGTSWFDAYYMSLVTLSTVGFGEVITLNHTGRLFTSFLILFNIGFFTYAISTVTSIFSDPEIHAFFFDFKIMERIKKLQQHTIVCGYGRHAGEVCKELARQKMPFVIIEMDPKKAVLLGQETDYLFLQGDATTDEVLQEAGIDRATSLVVTLPSDANNVFVVLTARQINPSIKIISRLNNASDELKLRRAGANHVVIPEQIGGYYMATLINKPDLVAFFNLISNMGTNHVVFEEIAVAQLKEQFRGRSIAQSGIEVATQIPIMALRHTDGRYQLNPPSETLLQPGMQIVVLGDDEQIKRFCSLVLADGNDAAT